jgi:predicted tellurium resistance membrane protein TerC
MRQSIRLIAAAICVCALAALLVQVLLQLVALRTAPDVYHVAFIRTLSICAFALALAFAGVRWRRPELTRIAYATVVFIAAKLIFEDLRHGHLEFIAASIFLFAITLIAVPRLAHMGQKS